MNMKIYWEVQLLYLTYVLTIISLIKNIKFIYYEILQQILDFNVHSHAYSVLYKHTVFKY